MMNEGQDPTATTGASEGQQQALEEATRKSEEYLRLLQRLQADFNNYKRRTEQERQELSNLACSDLAVKLLPALDDLDKAMKALPQDLSENDWVAGIQLIRQKLESILRAEGLVRIEAQGAEFDPYEHDAVVMEEAGDARPGTVKTVLREGYKFRGRVVRPAQVSVARRQSNTDQNAEKAEQ